MKTMKKKMVMLFTALMMCVMLVPAIKAEAAMAQKPTGLKLYAEKPDGNDVAFSWDLDEVVISYMASGYGGYEFEFKTVKNKRIALYDVTAYSTNAEFGSVNNGTTPAMIVSNKKLRNQAYKVRMRAYTIDPEIGAKEYSDWTTDKTIVPMPKISVKRAGNGKIKVTWNKVAGAKSYTVYKATAKSGKYGKFKKAKTVTGKSCTISGFKTYVDYGVYVQADKVKVGKKKVNSTKVVDKESSAYGFYFYTTYR